MNGTKRKYKVEKVNEKQQKNNKKANMSNSNGKGDADSSTTSSMPATYPDLDAEKTFDERLDELTDTVIVDCKPQEVESGFDCYVDENVDKDEWKAVWKSHHLSSDIVVEVKDVCFPNAKVELSDLFCCQPNSLGNPPKSAKQRLKTKDDVAKFLSDHDGKVSLLELIPVRDDSGDLDRTAEVLELYRFFYTYIWRVSDDDDCDDYYFAMHHLHPRMKIFYDVQNNKADKKTIAEPYTKAMERYQKKHWQFKMKQEELGDDDEIDEEDQENQKEVQELNKLWTAVCSAEKSLKTLTQKANKPKRQANKGKKPKKPKRRWVFTKVDSPNLYPYDTTFDK